MSTVDPRITALETLLARKKQLSSLGISLDGYGRWGNGGDPKFEAFARKELAERSAVERKLNTLVKRHRNTTPWALSRTFTLTPGVQEYPDRGPPRARPDRARRRQAHPCRPREALPRGGLHRIGSGLVPHPGCVQRYWMARGGREREGL